MIDIEAVRALADSNCQSDDDVLDFYSAAIELGANDAEADRIDQQLTVRVMSARGAI